MVSPEKQDLSDNEISSGSSDYEDPDDDYKEQKRKHITRPRTIRKRAVKLEKRVAAKAHPIRKKKREQQVSEADSKYEPYQTNTFVYFDEKDSFAKIEEVDEELHKNLEMNECDENGNDFEWFPQNSVSEESTEDLLVKLLEKRSKNIAEKKSQITHLPCNPFSEKLSSFRSVNNISGRCQNIVQTYHPNVFNCENPSSVQGVPSFVIWQEPFEYLVHQKNVLDINKNVKNIVQRKIDERLKMRKESLINEIIRKADGILKRNMSKSEQNNSEGSASANFNNFEENQKEEIEELYIKDESIEEIPEEEEDEEEENEEAYKEIKSENNDDDLQIYGLDDW